MRRLRHREASLPGSVRQCCFSYRPCGQTAAKRERANHPWTGHSRPPSAEPSAFCQQALRFPKCQSLETLGQNGTQENPAVVTRKSTQRAHQSPGLTHCLAQLPSHPPRRSIPGVWGRGRGRGRQPLTHSRAELCLSPFPQPAGILIPREHFSPHCLPCSLKPAQAQGPPLRLRPRAPGTLTQQQRQLWPL